MSYKITQTCVNCDMCEPECPNEAIVMGAEIYEIITERCTECIGYYDTPQCESVCPISRCCIPDPEMVEDEETLWQKFAELSDELLST